MNKYTRMKQKVVRYLYVNFAKKLFFMFDAELMHRFFVKVGKALESCFLSKKATALVFDYQNKSLEQEILGIKFRNPVGLAAGFDKDAEMISIMEDVGFGFSEVGSVSALACDGNSGKRLRRLVKEKALWINLGLNNSGAGKAASLLEGKKFKIPFGVSIARTNCKKTADEDAAIKDYCFSAEKFRSIGDYITINISCPNAYGGQSFSGAKRFEKLMKAIHGLKIKKPIFVKISPDLSRKEIDKIIVISAKYKISGFICSNLMKDKKSGSGGYSGKIVEKKTDDVLAYVYKKTRKTRRKFFIVGCGGIFSAEDAYKKIKLGANLVQLITGMIYVGPGLIGEINYGLAELLKKDRYGNISEAVGKGLNDNQK